MRRSELKENNLMSSSSSEASDPVKQLQDAFQADDAGRVREIVNRYPDLKARIDDPDGPFDSPAVVRAKSRAMLDVLLEERIRLTPRTAEVSLNHAARVG